MAVSQSINSKPIARREPVWIEHQQWLAPRLVVVTLVALILSSAGEHWFGISAPVILLLNITAYAAGGFYGALGAWEHLKERKVDIDLLMILAALGAAAIGQWIEGALLLFLFSLSNVLQDYALNRSRRAISGLMKLYPAEARVVRGNTVQMVRIDQIHIGDILQIVPGERIPVDGIVRSGHSWIDQAPITGESIPVEKQHGDKVFAGTLNQQGTLDIQATQAARDTVLARIIRMVEEAQDSKAPTQRFLETFEEYYAIFIIGVVALFIIVPPMLFGADFQSNFYRAMVLMTVASPCALVISTPAAFLSAIASAARHGVLFKGGAHLEAMAAVKAIAFDKTGTLTQGKPAVTQIVPMPGISEAELLALTASVEARSEHPLAQAVLQAAQEREIATETVSGFSAQAGKGVRGMVNDHEIVVGSPESFAATLPHELGKVISTLRGEGNTVMLAQRDGEWLGAIALADQLRPGAKQMIADVQKLGITTIMLTGDSRETGHHIANQIGIQQVKAQLLPPEKLEAIQQIQKQHGAVAMIGDGVNDAPALASADVGIAMGGAGSDVALETADVVLMGDRLELIPYAIAISKKARRVVWQNILFSLLVIVVLVLGTFVISLPLPLGVLGHEGSTVIVVVNGLIQLLLLPEIARRRAARA
ncbi:MAG: heavy metal translocating P-type ATPase [Chloroflexi bacterium OLB15]|nr:MAG: heavy metal translocating P-type ATPase [Chloroflexi bacterium OLB15]